MNSVIREQDFNSLAVATWIVRHKLENVSLARLEISQIVFFAKASSKIESESTTRVWFLEE